MIYTKYLTSEDPLNTYSDEEIIQLFIDKLRTVFPDLKDEEISHMRLFREIYVQPNQELNYLDRIVGFKTPLPNVYLVNTSMISDSTLNNNTAIALARKAVEAINSDL